MYWQHMPFHMGAHYMMCQKSKTAHEVLTALHLPLPLPRLGVIVTVDEAYVINQRFALPCLALWNIVGPSDLYVVPYIACRQFFNRYYDRPLPYRATSWLRLLTEWLNLDTFIIQRSLIIYILCVYLWTINAIFPLTFAYTP